MAHATGIRQSPHHRYLLERLTFATLQRYVASSNPSHCWVSHTCPVWLSLPPSRALSGSTETFLKPQSHPTPGRSFTTSRVNRSGHNKWSKIKHEKSRVDSQRSQTYSRLSKAITNAAAAGSDSPTLSDAVAAAKKAGMSRSVIDSAVQRGTGRDAKGGKLEDVRVEALMHRALPRYPSEDNAPSTEQAQRIALLIECQTSSKARTLQEVRSLLTGYGATITPTAHMFQNIGRIRLHEKEWYCRPGDLQGQLEDMLLQALDIQEHIEYTPPNDGTGGKDMPDVLLDFDYPPSEVAKRSRNENKQELEHKLSDFIVDTWAPLLNHMGKKLQEVNPDSAVSTEKIWLPKKEFAVFENGDSDSDMDQANTVASDGFHKLMSALELHADVKGIYHNRLDEKSDPRDYGAMGSLSPLDI